MLSVCTCRKSSCERHRCEREDETKLAIKGIDCEHIELAEVLRIGAR